MARLTNEELASRLAFDFRIIQAIASEVVEVRAFRSRTDAEQQRSEIVDLVHGAQAVFYLARFRVRSLVGPGKFHDRFDVVIDTLAGGNFPYSEPICQVISSPLPWNPHFAVGVPICLGEIWKDAKGRMTVAALTVHVAKLLNWDEPSRGAGYAGYRPEAIKWWKDNIGQPITVGLSYPVLPSAVTHEQPPAPNLFRAAAAAGGESLFKVQNQGFRPSQGT